MTKALLFVSTILATCLAGCTPDAKSENRESKTAVMQQTSGSEQNVETQRFDKLLTNHWNWRLKTNPTFATSLGVRDFDARLPNPSLEAYDMQVEAAKTWLEELNDIPVGNLSEDDQLNAKLLKLDLENQIVAAQFGGKYIDLTNRSGPHTQITGMPDRLPFFNAADYESYQSRLTLMPEYLDRATARMRAGMEAGWVQPCAPMKGYEASIRTHIVDDVNDSNFMSPFKKKPASMNQADFDALKARAAAEVETNVIPALEAFETFYTNDYAPACRSEVGTSTMSGGAAYYAYLAKMFTTTDLTPDEIHNIGLTEVARIRAEMDEVQKQAGYEGTFKAFQNFLRTNPEFYPKTRQERMDAAAVILKKMDGKLPELFTKFPRMPYGIKEIPLDVAEKTTTAYYSRPAGDGSRAGFYFINTSNLDKRPLYEMEALSLHEAVPGHHFQVALAQELPLPDFRKYGGVTAFIEGWGLYSERLGLDVGFYQTPYTNFGRLSYEMWRACRLVVDTGLHVKGWTRQEAIDYMAENTGLSLKNIENEVDRYITRPGQALAYKIGELKIRELRARAEIALGENFDLRLFHDAVLENGAVPLSVLEEKIDVWIKTQR